MRTILEIIAGIIISIIALIGAAAGTLVCWILIRNYDDDEQE